MSDKPTHQEGLKKSLHSEGKATNGPNKEADAEEPVVSGAAFGYLRGIKDGPGAVEVRFRDGTSAFFPYGWRWPWRDNPLGGAVRKILRDTCLRRLFPRPHPGKPLNGGGTQPPS